MENSEGGTEISSFLIVGLGNPGLHYERTRHNIGFEVLKAFAAKHGLLFKKESPLNAEWARFFFAGHKVGLLLPLTYMNRSGEAVAKALRVFKITENRQHKKESLLQEDSVSGPSYERLLVVVDDIYTPFGSMKMRSQGSSGGHNGLKSIELHLGSLDYPRLKMGVGPQNQDYSQRMDLGGTLEDYVLSRFSMSESLSFTEFVDNGVKVIESWLKEGMDAALRSASQLKI